MDHLRAFKRNELGVLSLLAKSKKFKASYLEYNLSTSKYYPFITLDIDNKIIFYYYTQSFTRTIIINNFPLKN